MIDDEGVLCFMEKLEKIEGASENKNAEPICLGDAVLRFDTANIERGVDSLIEKLQRALAAFKEEWNRP